MNAELARATGPSPAATPASAKKPTATAKPPQKKKANLNPKGPAHTRTLGDSSSDDEDDDDSDNEGMTAELAELFKSMPASANLGEDGEGGADYNMVKNFLESFQGQGGFGGPVGNLVGRLGVKMPKDA